MKNTAAIIAKADNLLQEVAESRKSVGMKLERLTSSVFDMEQAAYLHKTLINAQTKPTRVGLSLSRYLHLIMHNFQVHVVDYCQKDNASYENIFFDFCG